MIFISLGENACRLCVVSPAGAELTRHKTVMDDTKV